MTEFIKPADRQEWLALRRRDVTASQIAAVLGHHPFVTPYQLWASKSGLVPDEDLNTAAMRRGRLLESVAADLAAEAMPDSKVTHNVWHGYWRDPETRIGATPDLIVEDSNGARGVVQLKSVEPSVYARNWFDGEPPLWIALQAMTEARLVGAQWAAVGALRVGHGVDFNIVPIPLHDGVWNRITLAVAEFWRLVDAGTPPPPDYARDAATIAALYQGAPGSVIDLSTDDEFCGAVIERERLKRATKDFDKQCTTLEGLIRHRLGDHEVALAGNYRVKISTEQVKAYSVAASTRRRLRVKRLNEEKTA